MNLKSRFETVKLMNVRCAFSNIYTADKYGNKAFVLKLDTEQLKELHDQLDGLTSQGFNLPTVKTAEYEGQLQHNVKLKLAKAGTPKIYDMRREAVEGEIPSGAMINIAITARAWTMPEGFKVAGGRTSGISLYVRQIQLHDYKPSSSESTNDEYLFEQKESSF